MKIISCLIFTSILTYFLSGYLKKYKISVYIVCTVISLTAIMHACLILNGYSIKYIPVLKQLMNIIDSGALGGALFIIVMYIGALSTKNKIAKSFMKNRGELSIIACIFTIPHNIHYFFLYLFNAKILLKSQGSTLFTSLMMFSSGIFAIIIMIPLFITSFMFIRKKMNSKKWKNLQEYAYIFYAMIYIQVMMLYISRPQGINRTLSLISYTVIFISYTSLRIKKMLDKKSLLQKEKNSTKKMGININSPRTAILSKQQENNSVLQHNSNTLNI